MDWPLIFVYFVEKAADPALCLLAVVVGIVINLYGQILVPWLRGLSPLAALRSESRERPLLLATSVFIAFLFPFTVGLISGVATRYVQRHVEAHATFPDAKPDPVFRVDLEGRVVRMGARTRMIFENRTVTAPRVLGDQVWREVLKAHAAGTSIGLDTAIHYEPIDSWFLVAHSAGEDRKFINLYLTLISAELGRKLAGSRREELSTQMNRVR